MNPLYNAAAKHFKLTSLFSFNINFYILYPQLYYSYIDHHLVSFFFFFEQFSPVMVSNYEKGKNIIASVG